MMEEEFKATGMLLVPPQTTATSTATTASLAAEQIRKMMKVLSRGEAAAPTITHSQKEL